MLIGVNGYIGHGKDTVAKMIQLLMLYHNPTPHTKRTIENWKEKSSATDFVLEWIKPVYDGKNFPNEGHWQIRKFAGKLKEICSLLTGIPVSQFELQSVKDKFLGSEWDYWDYAVGSYTSGNYDAVGNWTGGDNHRMKYTGQRKPLDKLTYDKIVADGHVQHHDAQYHQMTVRELLQKMGTDAMRDKVHPNIHINALFADYKAKHPPAHQDNLPILYPNWIISDCRFPNEAQAIKDKGGIVIRVNRPRPDYLHDPEWLAGKKIYTEGLLHSSETSLDNWKFDWVLKNDNTLEELLGQVAVMLKENNLL